MKRISFVLLALMALACCMCTAFAVEVPPVTAGDFGGMPPEANPLWMILRRTY